MSNFQAIYQAALNRQSKLLEKYVSIDEYALGTITTAAEQLHELII